MASVEIQALMVAHQASEQLVAAMVCNYETNIDDGFWKFEEVQSISEAFGSK
jgi:hypothetical protein